MQLKIEVELRDVKIEVCFSLRLFVFVLEVEL